MRFQSNLFNLHIIFQTDYGSKPIIHQLLIRQAAAGRLNINTRSNNRKSQYNFNRERLVLGIQIDNIILI